MDGGTPGLSRSQVSALARSLDEEVRIWRTQSLTKRYPYLVVDTRCERIRRGGAVIKQGILIVIGIDEAGYREALGVWCADLESEAT